MAGVETRVPERAGRESLCFFGKTVPLFTALRKGKVCTSGLAIRQAEKGVQSGVLVLSVQKLRSGKGGDALWQMMVELVTGVPSLCNVPLQLTGK